MNLAVFFCDSHFISADVSRNATCNIGALRRNKSSKSAAGFNGLESLQGTYWLRKTIFILLVYCDAYLCIVSVLVSVSSC